MMEKFGRVSGVRVADDGRPQVLGALNTGKPERFSLPFKEVVLLEHVRYPEVSLPNLPPPVAAIYVLYLAGKPVYIGQSKNIRLRVQHHAKRIVFDVCGYEPENDDQTRRAVETRYINELRPIHNRVIPSMDSCR